MSKKYDIVRTFVKETRSNIMATRPTLNDLDHLSTGKRVRLHRLLYQFGPGNGTALFLPIDQGLEHGPRDFFPNPDSEDPEFQFRLAVEGQYSGIAVQIGLAQKYSRSYAGQVPLIVKLNGKTEIPSDAESFSACLASVEDAVALGADAVGYTLYVGSPAQDRDFAQWETVRRDADRFGMPTIIWAYPRGEAVEKKGGKESSWAIEYAARVGAEVGADVVKINFPTESPSPDSPKPYNTEKFTPEESIARAVHAAGKTLVLVSGGEKEPDTELLEKARRSFAAGATGLIFGRNTWQRPYEQGLQMAKNLREIAQSA
jgi:class I fructose-bisphosphate aldolase